MRNIIAIGGGSIEQHQTLSIDQAIIACTEKPQPNALFIPTASDDDSGYCNNFRQVYGEHLGCPVDTLLLVKETPDSATIREKIAWADLIYVGGGNTRAMVALWRELGVDQLLIEAADRGTVLSGLSAGCICWFTYGNSDAPLIEGRTDIKTMRVNGLGLIDAAGCPHMKAEPYRLEEFTTMMRTTPGMGIGIDDCCALHVRGQEYRLLTSAEDVKVHKIFWAGDVLQHDYVYPTQEFQPLETLLQR